jgi:hypothetical protein
LKVLTRKKEKMTNYTTTFETRDIAEKGGKENMVERGDINYLSPEPVHLCTLSNHVTTSNQLQNLVITCKKTNNWNPSALS